MSLHNGHGAGEPGSLQIDGKIEADGTAVPGCDTPRETEYGYNIDAKFEGINRNGLGKSRPVALSADGRHL
jgi:hypothetical protein